MDGRNLHQLVDGLSIICKLSTILLMVQDFATIQIQSKDVSNMFFHMSLTMSREAKVDLCDDLPSFADEAPYLLTHMQTHGAGI